MDRTLKNKGTRLDKLKSLADVLTGSINRAKKDEDHRAVASLAKQYDEVINEIEAIEDAGDRGDEITELLSARQSGTNS